jgi:hypothetical protein
MTYGPVDSLKICRGTVDPPIFISADFPGPP